MATYLVGDVQGCYRSLRRLLKEIRHDPRSDRLVFVGDLVNRGPRSLDVVRWAADQGERVESVLGNHDLHLLSRAEGIGRPRSGDTLDRFLRARDRDELLAWLRGRPFVVREKGALVVHAGLLPGWTASDALALSRAARRLLGSRAAGELLAAIAGRKAGEPVAPAVAEAAADAAVLTRLRTVGRDGRPCDGFNGPPEAAPKGCRAWYRVPGRKTAGTLVVFGHWAALGLHLSPDAICLDSGCVWGGAMTALRLPDRAVFQVGNAD